MKRFLTIFGLVVTLCVGAASLLVSVAAYAKSADATVIRNGFAHDYLTLSLAAAIIGTLMLVLLIFGTIRYIRSRPQPPASHF